MVGRKPKSQQVGPNAYLPIELYGISTRPNFVRGAKREIRDKNNNLLLSERQQRFHFGGTYTKDQVEIIIRELTKNGAKDIKTHKRTLDFPRKCPNCDRFGNPDIVEWKKRYTINEEFNTNKKTKTTKLIYNHKSKPKTCLIGEVIFKNGHTEIKLKKGLPIDCLGHRRRIGTYSLQ